jgi:hypothetical protein
MPGYVQASEYPILTGGNRVETWYGAGALNPCPVIFNPATGPAAGINTVFVYARGFSNPPTGILPGGFQEPCSIGVITQRVNFFDPDPSAWNLRASENPVIENGGASPWDNSRFRAPNAIVLGGKIVVYASAYDNPNPSSRLFRWESSDGFTFSSPVELTFNGGYFGRPCRGVFEANGRVWMLIGDSTGSGDIVSRTLRSSPDGISNWITHGDAIELGTEAGAGDDYAMSTGFVEVDGDFAYCWVPACPTFGDWPEVVMWHRIPLSELGTTDRIWDRHPEPQYVRGPNEGAIWSFSPMTINGTRYGFKEHAGMADWTDVGSTEMNDARDDDYAGYGTDIFSHISIAIDSDPRSLAEAWAGDVLPTGDVVLRNVESGAYLTPADTSSTSRVVTKAEITEQAVWTMDVIRGFRRLSVKAAGAVGSQVLDLTGAPDANRNIGTAALINPDNGDEDKAWYLPRVGDQIAGRAPVVAIISRESSLALQATGEGDDAQVKQYPYRGLASQMWEVVEVVPAGETATIGTDDGVVTVPLPAGDLVGTTAVQTLSNKTMHLAIQAGSRADLVASLPDFASMADGDCVITTENLRFIKLDGATVIGDMPGFLPGGELTHFHFGPVATDMGAAAIAAITYAATLSTMVASETLASGAVRLGPKSLIKVNLMGAVLGTSVPIWPVDVDGVELTNGVVKSLAGTMTASDYVIYPHASGSGLISTIALTDLVIDCNDVSSGIHLSRIEYAPSLDTIKVAQIAAGGKGIHTSVKVGDLRMNNITVAEHAWSDAARVDQVNRTAIGIDIGTADCQLDNIKLPYNMRGLVKSATGPVQIGKIHFYQGAITGTVDDASDIIGMDIQYPSGVNIADIYAGNAAIHINCDELNGATGNKAMSIGRVQFFATGAGDSDHLMRFTTTVANNDMAGLKMGIVTGKDGGINAFRWAPTGAGSFLPLNRLKWTVPTLTDATGEPFQHTDDAGVLLADASPILANAGWMNLDQDNVLRFGGSQPGVVEWLNGVTLQVDANNSGATGFTVLSDVNTLLVSNETTPLGVNEIYIGLGLASGGSHIARIGYSGDALVITPTNATGDAEDNAKQLRFDTTARVWHVEGGFMITGTSAPASASATGTLGEIRMDASYIYICTATNTWKRVAIATW